MNRSSEAGAAPFEKHYTVSQIAQRWSISDDTVRRIFADEPGVLNLGSPSQLLGGRKKIYKRRYFILRIPESVFLRVQERLMHKRPSDHAILLGRTSDSGLHAS